MRLVVIPSDPIAAYEQAGYDWLERYFNPQRFFRQVFILSPLEKGERHAHGLTIIGTPERAFKKKLRELRPNAVRAYGGYWPADLACTQRLWDIPVLVSIHDSNPAMLHQSVRYADLVICMSKIIAQRVIALGTDPDRVRILPNRVDTEVFYPIRDRGRIQALADAFPPSRYILHIGRKSPEKNLDTLIRALCYLPPIFSCIFIGRGDCGPYIALAESLGVAERCFWIDSIKNSDLPLWLSWCDCMCVPSRHEGFGLVFIEAAACGTAIVTSDIAPMNEYLANDVSACLVREYEDPKRLAEAIRKVCEDSDYRRTISAGALEVAEPFELSSVDSMETGIYREAIALGCNTTLRRVEIASWQMQGELLSAARRIKQFAAGLRGRTRRLGSMRRNV